MDQWQCIGTHFVRIEADTLFIRFIGDVGLEDTRAITVLQEQIITQHGRVFAITNLHESRVFHPEGRRFLGEWNKKFSVAGVAQYGGSVMSKAMAILMLGAIRTLGGKVPEMKYVSNEEEGRDWVSERRRILSSAGKR